MARSPHSGTLPEENPFVASCLRYSAQGTRDLIGLPEKPGSAERELSRLTERVRVAVQGAGSGEKVVDAVRRVLVSEEGFVYDRAAKNPGNYLLGSVLARKRGNCLGLSMLCLAIAERLGLPFRGVYLPSHCFVRYDGGGAHVNMDFADGGASWGDDRYRSEFGVGPDRPYLRSLSADQMLGVFLKSLGAGYSLRGRDEEALRLYEAAGRLYPGLPDVYYNSGVSLQKLGRNEEAIAGYRKALALDPEMAAPRDNMSILFLGKGMYEEAIAQARRAVELEPWNAASRGNLASAYCACGRFDEGIREYRRAKEIAPENPRVRAGLARAYFARGTYRQAAQECGRAEALGCRFDPAMLKVLARYREERKPRGALP